MREIPYVAEKPPADPKTLAFATCPLTIFRVWRSRVSLIFTRLPTSPAHHTPGPLSKLSHRRLLAPSTHIHLVRYILSSPHQERVSKLGDTTLAASNPCSRSFIISICPFRKSLSDHLYIGPEEFCYYCGFLYIPFSTGEKYYQSE